MKKNTNGTTSDVIGSKAIKATKKHVDAKKLEAEKLKKQKKREAAKAKRLKLIEKHKAQVEANKAKRAAKKAKKLAKLEKERARKAALREKKKAARIKKLERIAKQKAKAKELKLKAKEKAKLEKAKNKKIKILDTKTSKADIVGLADTAVDAIKNLEKEYFKLEEKKQNALAKKLAKLGFNIVDGKVTFGNASAYEKPKAEVVDPEVVTDNNDSNGKEDIDAAIDTLIGNAGNAIESLAKNIEDDDVSTETPIGDTYTDNNIVLDPLDGNEQPNDFDEDNEIDEDDDNAIDDFRDESDDDKVNFRREWNNEFGDDGEQRSDW